MGVSKRNIGVLDYSWCDFVCVYWNSINFKWACFFSEWCWGIVYKHCEISRESRESLQERRNERSLFFVWFCYSNT